MKKSIKTLLYVAGFFVLNTTCRNLTDDFSQDDLILPEPKNSVFASMPEPENLDSILAQKYTYLGKGKQAFVFASEDKRHVLKLFKPAFPPFTYHLFGKPYKLGLSKLPFAKTIFANICNRECAEQKKADFLSYVNSFELLKNETRLEYLHLAETDHLQHKLKFYDKIGVLRELDLDKSCFLIQKKTDLLYPTLGSLIKQGKTDEAKRLLKSFVDLSFAFINKGIDNPTTVEKNFGCIGLEAVQIDVGRVLIAEDFEEQGPKTDQIYHSVHHMKKWLAPRSEVLNAYLDELVESGKNSYQKDNNETAL